MPENDKKPEKIECREIHTEHTSEYDALYALCYRLETKVNRVSSIVKWIGILTIVIALISIALSIGNAVAGCGCNHSQDCNCSSCLYGWGVAALVLGVISGMLSLAVAILGIVNDATKEQVFTTKHSAAPAPTPDDEETGNEKDSKIVRFKKNVYVLLITLLFLSFISILLSILLFYFR